MYNLHEAVTLGKLVQGFKLLRIMTLGSLCLERDVVTNLYMSE